MLKALFILTALALVQARPGEEPAQANDRRYELHPDCPPIIPHYLLPHEYDCTKFYYCEYGFKWIEPRDCSPGTEFSATEQVCTHPISAGCTLPGFSTVAPAAALCDPLTTTPGSPCATEPPATVPPTVAPTTQAPVTEGTNAPCSTTTAGPGCETQPPVNPTTIAPTTNEDGDCETLENGCPADWHVHKLLPHEEWCHKFYYCDKGELVERYCANGTYFNYELQVCDWPRNVDCVNDGSYEYPSVEEPDVPGPPEIGDCLDNGCPADFSIHHLLPHESDCEKFYYCVFGEKVERDCAEGTHFNFELQVCDWPQNAGCEFYVPPVTNPCDATTAGPGGCNPEPQPTTPAVNPTTTTTTANPSPCDTTTAGPGGCNPEPEPTTTVNPSPCDTTTAGPGGCNPEGPGGVLPNDCPADFSIHWLLPHESDCNKFYYCVFGELVERDCPEGTHFNPTLQVCDWPQFAGCAHYEPPVTNPCDATTAGPDGCNPEPQPTTPTVNPTTTTTTANPSPCDTTTTGPGGCNPDPEPTTTANPSPCDTTTAGPGGCNPEGPGGVLPNDCPADFSIHWLLPHESDCNKFYYCVFGELVERDCPEGTHFNPTLQVCDWPQFAGCAHYEPPVTNPCDATTAGPDGCNPEPQPTTPTVNPTTTTTTANPSPCDTTTTGPGGCNPDPEPTTTANPSPCDTTTAGPGGCNPEGPGVVLPNDCPADFSIHWLLPHESDCNKFYYCVFGELVERDCPEGTHFNPTLQVCDWPQFAGCAHYEPPVTNPCDATTAGPDGCNPEPQPTTPTVNPTTTTTTANPSPCDTTTTGPGGCNPDTEPTTTANPSPCDTTTAGPGGCNPEGPGVVLPNDCPADFSIHWLLPHESDCNKFYYCVFGELVERDCPEGTHFNPTLQVCDWPQFAGCAHYEPPVTNPCDATTAGPDGCNPEPQPTTPTVNPTTTTTTANPSPCDTTTTGPGGCNPDTEPTTTANPSPCDTTTAGPGGCNPEGPGVVLPNDCPADFSIHWLLPHESDCNKFYYCVFGELVERDCPEGTHFNPTLQVCDWPQFAGCAHYEPPVTNPCDATTAGPDGCNPEPQPTTPTVNPTTTTTTANPSPCDTTTTGPGGCNPDPEPTTTANPSPCDTTTAGPGGCNPEGPGGVLPNDCPADFSIHWLLPHESDCNKFYYCVFGELVERDCPEGTHFNPTLQVCDWPQFAGCAHYEPPVTNPCDATTAGPDGCNPEPQPTTPTVNPTTTTTTANPSPCDTTTTGPGGCNPDTEPTTTANPSPCDTTTAGPGGCNPEGPGVVLPNDCPADFSIHWLLPHESDCNKFYYCVFGELVERDCPEGTHFNPTLQVCDWPQFAGCAHYEPPVTNPCDATTAGPDGCNPEPQPTTPTVNPTTTTTTANPSPCDTTTTGPGGCNPDPEPTTTANPSPCDTTTAGPGGCNPEGPGVVLPNDCPADFSIHWLLPHESDCNKFYYCVFGELVERDCPEGTHFNPTLQVCDWPQFAGCAHYEPPVTNPCDATTAGPGGCNPEPVPSTTANPSPCDTTTAGPGGCNPDVVDRCSRDCNVAPWAHDTDCDKFWICNGDRSTLVTCSEGLHFNPTTGTCDFICNAGCAGALSFCH